MEDHTTGIGWGYAVGTDGIGLGWDRELSRDFVYDRVAFSC